MTITFVTYHCDISEKAIREILEKSPVFREQRWNESLYLSKELISLLFKSIDQFHPGCKKVILTDQSTPFEPIDGVEIRRTHVDPDKPAYMRLCAQIDYLKNSPPSHVIFLDYDMLIQENLSFLFEKSFDIGLSFRLYYGNQMSPCPINGGLMLIPQKHRDKAIAFLELVKETYERNYPNDKSWGGFQRSISDVVGDENIFHKKSDLIKVRDTRILLLPDDPYNFTIGGGKHLVEYQPDKKILHFKGQRKKDMIVYWNEYLKQRT